MTLDEMIQSLTELRKEVDGDTDVRVFSVGGFEYSSTDEVVVEGNHVAIVTD